MPKTIPQNKRLKPKKGFDIITVKDGRGNEVRQRYVKRKGLVQSVKEAITAKPGSGDATGTGGRKRQKAIDEQVDAAG